MRTTHLDPASMTPAEVFAFVGEERSTRVVGILRGAILAQLRLMGQATVTELAHALRSRHGPLIQHLRRMERAGEVKRAELRRGRTSVRVTVYAPTVRQFTQRG